MKSRYSRKPSEHTVIAEKHVEGLFLEADRIYGDDPKLADHYVDLARKTAMKFKLKLKPEVKRKFCRHCYCYFRPGTNCTVRVNNGKVIYSCFSCKKFSRFPLK